MLPVKFLDLPPTLHDFTKDYYSRVCNSCGKTPSIIAVCFMCGEICCHLADCCLSYREGKQYGELTTHTETCGGKCGLFICASDGSIVCVEKGRSANFLSPYRNEFGTVYDEKNTDYYDNYELDM